MTAPVSNEQNGSKVVETRITEVTVYTNRALVTRRGVVALNGDERELVLTSLPPTIEADSVRASAVGTVKVQLLGVRTEFVTATEPVADKEAGLTSHIRQLEEQIGAVNNQIQGLQLQHTFIQNLGTKAVDRFSQSLARQQTNLEETGKLLEFLGQQHDQYSTKIAELERERQRLDREVRALRRQLEVVRIPESRENYNLIVAIEPAGPGELQLEISYTVIRASWTPLYDLRVNNSLSSLSLTYLAEVTQNSGEDWKGVKLTLSTAKPGLGSLPPKLNPWYIDAFKPFVPAPAPAMRMRKAGPGEPFRDRAESIDLSFDFGSGAPEPQAAPPPEIKAENVAAEAVNEGGVVTFKLDRDSDIPGDNNPHKITIFNDEYPCHAEYLAIPRLVSFAYLQANVTNKSAGVTLLPGKASIFRDNTFVGTTELENVAPGQEFRLNLGIDEGLKIERDLVEREVDKKLIGAQRRITYAYRLVVTNLRDQEALLRLTEQLPVSRSEQIKIRLTRVNPQIQPGELGALEWSLTLAPKARKEFFYQFTVEHPTDLTVTGLGV